MTGSRWRHFVQKPLELSRLVPRRHTQRDVLDPGIEVAAELIHALLRTARRGKSLDEFHTEIGSIVFVEKRFAFVQCRIAIGIDVDVMVERAADFRRIAGQQQAPRLPSRPIGQSDDAAAAAGVRRLRAEHQRR